MRLAKKGLLIFTLTATASCYSVNNRLVRTLEPPDDLYHCLQLELGRSGYAIVGADRASGWLHAQRRVDRVIDVVQAEVYATVIAEEAGGTHLQLTDNSHASDDAAHVLARCTPHGTIERDASHARPAP